MSMPHEVLAEGIIHGSEAGAVFVILSLVVLAAAFGTAAASESGGCGFLVLVVGAIVVAVLFIA